MGSFLRWLGRGLLLMYVLLAIVVLGVRYWLLPSIDTWREPISQALSAATQTHIQLGRIQARWDGLVPEITVHDVQLLDAEHHSPQVHIPYMQARLKWRSLLQGEIHFSSLMIEGLTIVLWRDQQHQLHIGGQLLKADSQNTTVANDGFFMWLGQHDQLQLKKSQLIWQDFTRAAPELVIQNLEGVIRPYQQQLQFRLSAEPSASTAKHIELHGYLVRRASVAEPLQGVLYTNLQGLNPMQWRSWLDLPAELRLQQAQLNVQLWMEIEQNAFTKLTLDASLNHAGWDLGAMGQIEVEALRVFAQSNWQDLHTLLEQPEQMALWPTDMRLELALKNAQWLNSPALSQALHVQRLELGLNRTHSQPNAPINITHLQVENADVAAQIQGSVELANSLEASQFDLHAQLERVNLQALYGYFPMPDISLEVVDWLREGLLAGSVPKAQARFLGKPMDYPFANPQQGIFFVGGAFEQATIDYYPSTTQEKGWPKLTEAAGYLTIRGNSLWVNQATAKVQPAKEQIQAEQIAIYIDDFSADEPQLFIDAQTTGPAQGYLGLMTSTDLGGWLDHQFDQSTSEGNWRVPLRLQVNLEDEEQTKVAGAIIFEGNKLRLLPYLPAFEQLSGELQFTELGATLSNIEGQWLGGKTQLQGKVGQPNEYITAKGHIHMAALAQYFLQPNWLVPFQGRFAFESKIGLDKNTHFYLQASSDLVGLASDLPQPLTKIDTEKMPLKIEWSALNTQRHQLQVQLAQNLQLKLVENTVATPYFERGVLAWRQAGTLAKQPGLVIDIQERELNLQQWQDILQPLFTAKAEQGTWLPDLAQLRIKADELSWQQNKLTYLTYTLHQLDAQRWRSDISSEQVAGTVHWQHNQVGKIQGVVQADLERLHWQLPERAMDSTQSEAAEFDLNLPDLNIRIADLRLNQRRIGALELQGRQADSSAEVWQIPLLSLRNPHGELTAAGRWNLSGKNRGLTLSSQLKSDAVGDFLSYVGFADVMGSGQGSVQVQVDWKQFPWRTDLQNMRADIDLNLHQGRLYQLNSKTAKLLELLSLQSLPRLARLDLDIGSLVQDGFPFTDIKGQLWLEQHVLHTKNFRVIGPVGTIILEGQTDLQQEGIDMQAVVVPNVDISGATIAAGIALNPVIGISAFLTQFVLKTPLAKAMTVNYQLSGTWEEIEIKDGKK